MPMAERSWINGLRPGIEIDERYVVRSRDLRQRRGGGPYLAATIGDRTGEVVALAWENVDRLARVCEPGRVVRITGQVQKYQGRLQVVIREASPVPLDEIAEDDFVRSSAADPTVLWGTLQAMIGDIEEPNLKQLLYRVFSDPEVEEAFRTAPAARSMHHAYRAGLLEHTVSAAGAGRLLARHYGLHEDLVVTGLLLHDLGKIWELEAKASIEYTDDGRLLGHLVMETLYADRTIAGMGGFPEELRRQLLHILLSHHGEYAYGSPRRPKSPEAMLVHLVDNADSRLAGMAEAIAAEGQSDEAWSQYSRMLERNVYRRRP
jgi:3'-5' exoribonuclease